MKQKLPILLIALTAAVGAHAFSYTYGGQTLNYEATSATTCMLVSYEANASNGAYVIPEKVTNDGNEYTVVSIGDAAFNECTGMNSVVIPESVRSIGEYAFYRCRSLKRVNIPESVTSIEKSVFSSCTDLISVVIPESVTSIREYAFEDCSNLTLLVLPESVTSIGEGAFSFCGLTSLVIPESVTSIGDAAFQYCESLTSVNIPKLVTSIRESVFRGCSDLTSVVIPESVTSIGENSFSYCGLTSLVIPESVTSIGKYAFYGCGRLTSVEIPESVTSIGENSFNACGSLTSLIIPKSVTFIGGGAFNGSSDLESIIVYNPDPSKIELGSNVFTNVRKDFCYLYVPQGSQKLYANAPQWCYFENIQNIQNNPYQVDLVDGEAYDNDVDSYNVDVTYTRTYTNTSWQALYIPFDMEYADWADLGDIAKLNNVHQYDTDGDGKLDKTTLEFNLVTDTITANTPYVFRPKEAGELTFRVSEATLKAAPATDAFIDCASTENVYTIYGTYSVKEGLYDQGAYALSPAGQFVKAATPKQTLKPYRIYMIITDKNYGSSSQQAPARISVTVDGEAAGIDDIEILQQIDDRYYDLMGRPVENPQTGIYIRGGEKVYVK